MPAGRPSKYNGVDLKQVQMLAEQGWTDAQMAKFFGVCEDTWHEWKKVHPKFSESLRDWKVAADFRVERSLYESAIGYTCKETVKELIAANGLNRNRESEISYTTDDWLNALEFFDNRCAYCGNSGKMTKDHVVPLSKGGKLEFGNVVPCCQSCNSRKKDRDLSFWYEQDASYDKEREAKLKQYLSDCEQIKEHDDNDSKKSCLVVTKEITKKMAPNTTACIFWLKNRKKEEWRDRHEFNHSGNVAIENVLASGRNRSKNRDKPED